MSYIVLRHRDIPDRLFRCIDREILSQVQIRDDDYLEHLETVVLIKVCRTGGVCANNYARPGDEPSATQRVV